MSAVRTLVVWCPDWPVVAAGIETSTPVAVLQANRVVACSEAARAEGVKRGLRRREAQGRCPDLVVVEHDLGRDARAFEPVVAALEALCPRIEIVRPGVCAFATRGPSRYFGGDEALAALVAGTVGVPCRSGIADGPFAAGLAARTAMAELPTIVAPGTSRSFLADFPVSTLERPELADLLIRLGLHTLGDLAALPAVQVLARFGPDGALAARLARGLDERLLAARTPPPDLAVSAELDPPADRVDRAAFLAKSLADELTDELARQGLACTRISIEAETEHGETLVRLWRHDGALTPTAMAERVRWQLDGWLSGSATHRPTAGIVRLRLAPDEVKPDLGRQLGFWGGSTLQDARATRALARVQGMLGPDAVCTATLQGGRSQGEQVRLVPWGDDRAPTGAASGSGRSHAEQAPWPGSVPAPAPATFHVQAVPAEVLAADGTVVTVTGRGLISAPPHRLSIAGRRWADLTGWAGPWPVDERWWDPPAHRRRARLQVLEADGTAHLLAVEGGRWWVEATYD